MGPPPGYSALVLQPAIRPVCPPAEGGLRGSGPAAAAQHLSAAAAGAQAQVRPLHPPTQADSEPGRRPKGGSQLRDGTGLEGGGTLAEPGRLLLPPPPVLLLLQSWGAGPDPLHEPVHICARHWVPLGHTYLSLTASRSLTGGGGGNLQGVCVCVPGSRSGKAPSGQAWNPESPSGNPWLGPTGPGSRRQAAGLCGPLDRVLLSLRVAEPSPRRGAEGSGGQDESSPSFFLSLSLSRFPLSLSLSHFLLTFIFLFLSLSLPPPSPLPPSLGSLPVSPSFSLPGGEASLWDIPINSSTQGPILEQLQLQHKVS